MENQHRKITGYRELSADEISLMNEIKAKGVELEQLVARVTTYNRGQRNKAHGDVTGTPTGEPNEAEVKRLDSAQPERWASVGRTHLQEGLMALTRAVAQPTSF